MLLEQLKSYHSDLLASFLRPPQTPVALLLSTAVANYSPWESFPFDLKAGEGSCEERAGPLPWLAGPPRGSDSSITPRWRLPGRSPVWPPLSPRSPVGAPSLPACQPRRSRPSAPPPAASATGTASVLTMVGAFKTAKEPPRAAPVSASAPTGKGSVPRSSRLLTLSRTVPPPWAG